MDFANERYVRLYTRDTADLIAAGWEGRLVFYEILRKVDRSGVLSYGGDLDLVAELLRVPRDTFRVGLDRLVSRDVMEDTGKHLIIPHFIDAQECRASDAKRSKEYRERQRDTKRDGTITSSIENVTSQHTPSHAVTPSRTVPSRTVLSPLTPQTNGQRLSREAWRDIWNGAVSEIDGPTSTRMYTGSTEKLGKNDRKFQVFLDSYTPAEASRAASVILCDSWWRDKEIGILTLSRGHNMDDMLAKGGKAPEAPKHGFQVHARKEG